MYVDVLSHLEEFGDGEEPWADFIFDMHSISLVNAQDGVATALKFEMRAKHVHTEVGIGVDIADLAWQSQQEEKFCLYWGRIALRSLGTPTDNLLRLYEKWWGLEPNECAAAKLVSVSAVTFDCDPRTCAEGEVSGKLFFDPERKYHGDGEDPLYGELFVRFDVPSRRAWLREKDPSYRRQVAAWLSGQVSTMKGQLQ